MRRKAVPEGNNSYRKTERAHQHESRDRTDLTNDHECLIAVNSTRKMTYTSCFNIS